MKKIIGWFKDSDIRNIIAIITVVGSFIMMYLIIIKAIPPENKDTVNLAFGFVLGAGCAAVYGYYFGNSKSDKKPEDPKP